MTNNVKKKTMNLVKVVSGIYVGKIGWATGSDRQGNITFYPFGGEYPYRVCLSMNRVASF